MKKINFIGVGIMGKSIVCSLTKAGYEITIYTRTGSRVEDIISEGAVWCKSAGECAKGRQAVISIMGHPKGVEDIYFDGGDIIANADPGTFLIGMTTTSPRLAMRIYEEAKKAGLHALDVPVTGGDKGTKGGVLAIPAGGDREDFDVCLSTLQAVGKNIDYEDRAGNGQCTKMCNQTAVAGALTGACKTIVYARDVGLGIDTVLKSISTGAVGSVQMSNMAPKTLQGDYRPRSFIKHLIKDMNLTDEETRAADTESEVLEDVLSMYKELEREGMGELGTQALVKYYN